MQTHLGNIEQKVREIATQYQKLKAESNNKTSELAQVKQREEQLKQEKE